jgi:hypothetical protein
MLILFAVAGFAAGAPQPQDTSQALREEVAQMRVEAADLEARAAALEARIAALEGRSAPVGDASAVPQLGPAPVQARPESVMIVDGAGRLNIYGQVQASQTLEVSLESPLDQTYAGVSYVSEQSRYVAEIGLRETGIELDRAFVEHGEFLLGQTDSLIVDPASLYGGQANHSPQSADAGRFMPTSQRLFRPQIRWDNGSVAVSIEQDDDQGRSLAVSHRWSLSNGSRLSTTAFGREDGDGSTGYGLSLSGRLNWDMFSIGGLLIGGHNASDILHENTPDSGENFMLASFYSEQRWAPRFRSIISIGSITHSDVSVFYPIGVSSSGSGPGGSYQVRYSVNQTRGDDLYTASATAIISLNDQIELGLEYRHRQRESFELVDYELISSTGIVPAHAIRSDERSEQISKDEQTILFVRSRF